MGHGFSHLYKMQICKLNKKGVDTISSVAIVLLVVGVVLGFTFIFLNTLTEDLSDTSATVTNETITPLNSTPVWLKYNSSTVDCYDSLSIISVANGTEVSVEIGSGNYSFDPAGTITWNGLDYLDAILGTWNVTYSYMYDESAACRGIEDTITGIAKLPGWLGLIVLLFIIGILLVLVYRHVQAKGGGTTAEI